jgi:hypothetical protein
LLSGIGIVELDPLADGCCVMARHLSIISFMSPLVPTIFSSFIVFWQFSLICCMSRRPARHFAILHHALMWLSGVEGVLWIVRTGAPWRGVEQCFSPVQPLEPEGFWQWESAGRAAIHAL